MHSTKRAQTTPYFATWIVFTMLMLVIIMGVMMFWLANKLNPSRDTFSLQATLLAQRIVYAPDGLAFYDTTTGRSIPGVIDSKKLTNPLTPDALLAETFYPPPNQVIAAKVTIGTATVYYNEAYYKKLQPLVGKSGAGAAREENVILPVLLRTNNVDAPAEAVVSVVRGNS
jgi:hypothetical protein